MSEPLHGSVRSPSPERPRRSLGRRLLAWVLAVSAINALFAISVQLYVDYRRDLGDLANYLSFIHDSQRPGLAAAAWNFDRPMLEAQLSGLLRSPWVSAGEVLYGPDESQRVIVGGQGDIVGREGVLRYPLEFDSGLRTVQVGHLLVQPNLATVYRRTLDRGVTVVLIQGVKAFVFSLLLLLLLHRLIIRRLLRLRTLVGAYQPGSSEPLQLLSEDDRRADDELSALIRSLATAQARLDEFHRQGAERQEQLEEEVHRRTEYLDQALLEQQAIFDNSLTGIAFIRERTIRRCNLSFEQMFGYPAGGLLGLSTRVLFPSQDAFEQEADHFLPVVESGGTYVGDLELERRDGSRGWFTVQLKLLDVSDPQRGVVMTLNDITARRDAELALERLARLDGLTGVANRRTLDEALASACRRAGRDARGLTLALLDVDCFKPYNDHYGHLAGDAALRAIAGVLAQAQRRPYDLAARYGGEEFALLLPECEAPGELLEQVRMAVLALNIPHAHSTVAGVVSLSIGAVSVPGGAHCEPAELFAAVDARLYEAKHAGRNRVMWSALRAVLGEV